MAEKETKPNVGEPAASETVEVDSAAPATKPAEEKGGTSTAPAPADYLEYLEDTYVRCGS